MEEHKPMDIIDVIRERRSVRRFLPDPIDRARLERVVDAAGWAPSGYNSQPWRFVVISGEVRDRVTKIISDNRAIWVERVRDKFLALHQAIFPEIQRRGWDLHPHWHTPNIVSTWYIGRVGRISFMNLRYLRSRQDVQRLESLMNNLLDRGTKINLGRILDEFEDGANKCALLFCDDLQVCREMLEKEANQIHPSRSVEDRMKVLVEYSVSPAYLAIRKEIGIAIHRG